MVIVDDHELLRAGTRRLLEDAGMFTVVGEADDGGTAFAVIADKQPDLAIVDIRLPSVNGIDLARRIVQAQPSVTVVILSAYDDEDYVRAALDAGVSGYLLKTTRSTELIAGILRACDHPRGRDGGCPDLATPARVDRGGTLAGLPEQLTPRERDVVRLAAQGLTNKVIARQLGISPRTVEGHLNHVFDKLGTSSRTELVHFAFTHGLLSPSVLERTSGAESALAPG